MPFNTQQKLMSLGLANPAAKELASQIDSRVYNVKRLMEVGFTPDQANIIATSPYNRAKASEVGITPAISRLIVSLGTFVPTVIPAASATQVADPYSFDGFTFDVLPNTAKQTYNATVVQINGDDYVRLEAHQGDRNSGDTVVDRVGLDGFVGTSFDVDSEVEFTVIPGQNSGTNSVSGAFWNFYENHAKKHPSYPAEYEGSGPLAFFNLYSVSAAADRFRIELQTVINDPPASSSDLLRQYLYDGPPLLEGHVYKFRVRTRRDDFFGYVRVFWSVDGATETEMTYPAGGFFSSPGLPYYGKFGYGPSRAVYPQFRIYRNSHPAEQVAAYKLHNIETAAVPADPNTRVLLVTIGDSNAVGTADDEASVSYTPDSGVVALNSSAAFAQYVPRTFTGMEGGVNTSKVGPEMRFAERYRTANPTKKLYICKNPTAGTTQTGQWDPVNGTLCAQTKTFVDQALAAMAAEGVTSPEVHVLVSLGVNENTNRSQYLSEARAMYTQILTTWGLSYPSRIIHIRPTLDNSNMTMIRAASQIIAHEHPRVFLIDSDGFGKSADVTHYNLAGLASIGSAAYDIATKASDGLDTTLLIPQMAFNNNTDVDRALTLNTGWSISGGLLVGSAVAAFGTATLVNDLPFEAGKTYTYTFTVNVTSGGVRIGHTGGTAVNSSTRTTSGTQISLTVVANANNSRFSFQAGSGGFTGDIDLVSVQKLP